tara:strand:- start:818 stop:991 length:174 start_codon:yes stop_codon:yes gene_type:complete
MNREQKKNLLKSKIIRMKQKLQEAEFILSEIAEDSNPMYLYKLKEEYIKKNHGKNKI